MNFLVISLIGAAIGTALITGLLFGFSICVMKALGRLPADQGIRTMQWINRDILNPLFISIFSGTRLLSLINVILLLISREHFPTIFIAASLGYIFGVFLITDVGNVPMNNRLDGLDPNEGETYWRKTYLTKWTRLNHLRTALGTATLLLFVTGFIQL